MTGKMIILMTDGTVEKLEPLVRVPTLEVMQQAVGGYIETVPFFNQYEGQDAVAFCNEEGKLEGLPVNATATELWHKQYPADDVLVGNVIVLTGDDAFMEAI